MKSARYRSLLLFHSMLLVVLTSVSSGDALAEPVSSGPLHNPARFTSIDEAAISALRAASTFSDRDEYAGCLYQIGADFMYTQPVTNKLRDEFSAACHFEAGSTFVGLFHTHPIGTSSHFTSDDVRLASELKVTSYLGSIAAGRVFRFVPGKTPTRCLDSNPGCVRVNRISHGEEVDNL